MSRELGGDPTTVIGYFMWWSWGLSRIELTLGYSTASCSAPTRIPTKHVVHVDRDLDDDHDDGLECSRLGINIVFLWSEADKETRDLALSFYPKPSA